MLLQSSNVRGVTTYLDRLLEATVGRVADAKSSRPQSELEAMAKDLPAPRPFADALKRPGLSVIAEIKRASPSLGEIDLGLEAGAQSKRYQEGGASAISVLTEPQFFKGSFADLTEVKAAVEIPVLRKDFIIDPYQVIESVVVGADAILLIVAALGSGSQLSDLHSWATEMGLGVLVEVHDEHELETALALWPQVIGINQRDLTTFDVDNRLAIRMRASVPREVVLVAESGIKDAEDMQALKDAGLDAVLIGETLVRSKDPAGELKRLLGG